MITKAEINCEIEFYKQQRNKIRARLRSLPPGSLYFKMEHGHQRAYTRIDGREKYLGRKHSSLIKKLAKRKELESALDRIENNIFLLEFIKADYWDQIEVFPPDPIVRADSAKVFSEDIDNLASPFRERGKHVTSDGKCVRSRAELILYEYFLSKGLEFYYEMEVMIDGQIWHPDFVLIRKSDGKIFIWEHFGMMNDDGYLRNSQRKLDRYAANGWWPMSNLIITYDFGNDSIDMIEIDRLLTTFELI